MTIKLQRLRLLKQVKIAEQEYRDFRTPKVRKKSHEDILEYLTNYDHPHHKTKFTRSWKDYRKTQYRTK